VKKQLPSLFYAIGGVQSLASATREAITPVAKMQVSYSALFMVFPSWQRCNNSTTSFSI